MKMFTDSVLPGAGSVPGSIEPLLQRAGPAPVPPTITVQPQEGSYDGITPVTLSVTATGDAPLTYQWYEGESGDTSTPIEGETAPEFDAEPETLTSYWVRVSNGVNPPADSDSVDVNIAPPVITVEPVGGEYDGITPVTLSVTATGVGLTYQWYTGATGEKNTIMGATSSTYDAEPVVETSYWCEVSNEGGAAQSEAAVVTLPPERPASTTMLLIADPDAAMSLTVASINNFHEQINAKVDFVAAFGGTQWSRQTAVLDGHNVARSGGDLLAYEGPTGADGLLDAWIPSIAGVALEGCFVLVFKPTVVDNGSGWLCQRTLVNVQAGMLNDGADKFYFQIRDTGGAINSVKTACALNQWHYAIMRWDATNIYVSIDGGTEVSAALTNPGGCSNTDRGIRILGFDGGGGAYAQGDFMEFSIIPPADIADMIAFLESEYPTLA